MMRRNIESDLSEVNEGDMTSTSTTLVTDDSIARERQSQLLDWQTNAGPTGSDSRHHRLMVG